MCFLFLLLFCIIKIKCFFFIFIFLFIWMQVWTLEKEDTPHSFSSRVFLYYYKFFLNFLLFIWFLHFCKFFFKKLFYCISLSLFHLFPFLFYSFIGFTFFYISLPFPCLDAVKRCYQKFTFPKIEKCTPQYEYSFYLHVEVQVAVGEWAIS
jgi:hypothetical protein